MKKGDKARLIQPIIEGEVVGKQFNDDQDCFFCMLEWTDENGDVQQRLFKESDLEEVAQ